ncbi:GNAT family N-acetyltransferase [Bacillus testis]|uniref:GNAT family N-acetyltransferase n=1 Tax=Bacillus testis TaxID=1622072 RepID=UPI00067ED18C|nr:GNAT family N-acetyltransferase [Bacillus testis]
MNPVLTNTRIRSIQEVEIQATIDKMESIQRRPKNPMGISIQSFRKATGLAAKNMPGPAFNTVKGFTDDDLPFLSEIIAYYKSLTIPLRFELCPGNVSFETFDELTRLGLKQTNIHTTMYLPGLSLQNGRSDDEAVTAKKISNEEMDVFTSLYTECFHMPSFLAPGLADNNRSLDSTRWAFYIASYQGAPAGVAILYMQGNQAYLSAAGVLPAYRQKGIHSFLLRERLSMALHIGCTTITSQAAYGSSSMRNMQRAGMQIAYNQLIWEK